MAKHHIMKAHRVSESKPLHAGNLGSNMRRCEQLASSSGHYPEKEMSSTHWTKGQVSPRVDLEMAVEKNKI